MHWRRFQISEIPYKDEEAFGTWVLDRWKEKDDFLEHFYNTGRFPSDGLTDKKAGIDGGYIETEVKLQSWLEVGQIFAVLGALAMVVNVLTQIRRMIA
jgi:lysocardiolipin and lysophospholipid acyltransferase